MKLQNDEELAKRDYLIHQLFAQTEAGVELMEIWQRSFIHTPGYAEGSDLYNLGRVEGRKEIVRNILLTIEKVENGR